MGGGALERSGLSATSPNFNPGFCMAGVLGATLVYPIGSVVSWTFPRASLISVKIGAKICYQLEYYAVFQRTYVLYNVIMNTAM